MSPNPPMKTAMTLWCWQSHGLVWFSGFVASTHTRWHHDVARKLQRGQVAHTSTNSSPSWKPTSAKAIKRPVDQPQLGCVQTESTVLRFSFQEALHELGLSNRNPKDFHPLLARGRDASPFHTTASGLTLRVHELVLVNELVLPESSIVTVELVLSRMKLPDVKMTRRVVLYTYCPVGAWVAHPKETTHRGQSPPGNNSPGSVAHKRTCLAALNNTWLAPGFTSQHLHKGKELTGYGVPRSTARLPAFRGVLLLLWCNLMISQFPWAH